MTFVSDGNSETITRDVIQLHFFVACHAFLITWFFKMITSLNDSLFHYTFCPKSFVVEEVVATDKSVEIKNDKDKSKNKFYFIVYR